MSSIIQTEGLYSKYTIEQIELSAPYKLYESQKDYIAYIIRCLNRRQNALIQSPTGSGKTLSLLLATLSWMRKQKIDKGEKPIRIIYTSRTHGQLKQVVGEIKKLPYIKPSMAILSSRQHSCINNQLQMLPKQSRNLECRLRVSHQKGLNCKYYHNEEHYTKLKISRLQDLQQCCSTAKIQQYCPYFYNKKLSETAEIILAPYNYLFDRTEEAKLDLENAIIILDEAHNIPSNCEDSQEFFINLSTITESIYQLSNLKEQILTNLTDQTEKQVQNIQIHISSLQSVKQNLQVLIEHEIIDVKQLQKKLLKSNKNSLQKLVTSAEEFKNLLQYRPFWALQQWVDFCKKLKTLLQNTNLRPYKAEINPLGSDIKVSIWCLNPAEGFKIISAFKPYTIILTSGTLTPMNTWPVELGIRFSNPLAFPSTIQPTQISSVFINEYQSVELNFGYEKRSNPHMYIELGKILLEIFKHTPNGVIVFFPSYGVLDSTHRHLSENRILSQLYDCKPIYYEDKNSKDFKNTLNNYLSSASKPKGSALFALVRGKVSQGLDFSDEKCRAVVMVGVPFPPCKEPRIQAKMDYLNESSKDNNGMTGNQWYMSETVRAINQSIGRIIRHPKDFGSVYLLDSRFNRKDVKEYLPSWISKNLKTITLSRELTQIILDFQRSHSVKNSDTNYFQFTSHLGTSITNKDVKVRKYQPRQSISIKLKQKKSISTPISIQEIMKEANLEKQKKTEEQIKKSQIQKTIFKKPAKKQFQQLQQCSVCKQQRKLVPNSQCQHKLCLQCWQTWLKNDLRCPICRVRIRMKFLQI